MTPGVFREVLRLMDRPRGASVVVEIAGPPTFTASLAALRPLGRMVTGSAVLDVNVSVSPRLS